VNYCISRPKGQFSTLVGDLICLGQKFYNDATQETQCWGAPNHTEPQPHPLATFPKLTTAWNNLTTDIEWWAPMRPYWNKILPNDWFGSCVLGTIWPCFFLLPLRQGKNPTIF
jgi:hypothetical protein